MKRFMSIMLVVLMATTTIFAGGSSEKAEVDPNAPVDLLVLFETQAVEVDPDGAVVKAINDRFNCNINAWELDPAKWYEQLNVRIAGGELPDAFVAESTGMIPSYVEGGIAAEVPIEYIREKAPHYAAAIDKYAPNAWDATAYNGKNYGFSQPMAVYPMAVYWNKNWLDAVGRDVPTTLEEMEDVLLAFVNEDPDGNGKKDTAGMAERMFNAVFGAYGVRCVTGGSTGFKVEEMQLDENGYPFFPYIRPEAKEALALLHKWYDMGIIDKEFVTGENRGGYVWFSHSFMNQKIGCTTAQVSHYFMTEDDNYDPGNMGRCMKEFRKMDPNARVVIGPAPIGPEGKSGTEGWAPIGKTIIFTQNVKDDPRKLDAILALLEAFYADPDFALLLSYGEKGVDWEMTEYGLHRINDGAALRRKGCIQFAFGNTMQFAADNRKAQHEFSTKVAPKGYYREIIPSVPEYSNTIATLTTLTEQAYFDIITGTKPIDYFDTYVDMFNKAGGAAAEKALRRAIDESRKN